MNVNNHEISSILYDAHSKVPAVILLLLFCQVNLSTILMLFTQNYSYALYSKLKRQSCNMTPVFRENG